MNNFVLILEFDELQRDKYFGRLPNPYPPGLLVLGFSERQQAYDFAFRLLVHAGDVHASRGLTAEDRQRVVNSHVTAVSGRHVFCIVEVTQTV